jgi:hypothetical protein
MCDEPGAQDLLSFDFEEVTRALPGRFVSTSRAERLLHEFAAISCRFLIAARPALAICPHPISALRPPVCAQDFNGCSRWALIDLIEPSEDKDRCFGLAALNSLEPLASAVADGSA